MATMPTGLFRSASTGVEVEQILQGAGERGAVHGTREQDGVGVCDRGDDARCVVRKAIEGPAVREGDAMVCQGSAALALTPDCREACSSAYWIAALSRPGGVTAPTTATKLVKFQAAARSRRVTSCRTSGISSRPYSAGVVGADRSRGSGAWSRRDRSSRAVASATCSGVPTRAVVLPAPCHRRCDGRPEPLVVNLGFAGRSPRGAAPPRPRGSRERAIAALGGSPSRGSRGPCSQG